MLKQIQRCLNNTVSSITKKISNEIVYEFIFLQTIDLLKSFAIDQIFDSQSHVDISMFFMSIAKIFFKKHIRQDVADAIAFTQMQLKFHYDRKHQSISLNVDDWALLRLHRDYNIPSAKNKKLDQQYIDSFQITEKIDRLTYRLEILNHWKIHPIFIIAQLKSSPPFWSNSFKRLRFTHSNSVYVEKNTKNVKSYILNKIINRRKTARRDTEYLIKWKEYGPESNMWRNLPKMNDVMNLMRDYEETMNRAVSEKYVQKRKSLRKTTSSKKPFASMNQRQRSPSPKPTSKNSSSKAAPLGKIVTKSMIIISFSAPSTTSLHRLSQKTFTPPRRFPRLLLPSPWM